MLAGIMAVHTFPLDAQCITDLVPRVDALILWLDQRAKHRRAELKHLVRAHGLHLQHFRILDATQPWRHCSGWIWREPLLRALDDIRPSFVLQPDSDEQFGPGFQDDFDAFKLSGKDLLMFGYDMPTADYAVVPTSPKSRHCKVLRWRPGLSYTPYRGYGKPNGKLSEMTATSRILHYCFYTPELQTAKVARMNPRQQAKFATRHLPPPSCT